jgi:tetratricopeptide (TPR) repeat protein
MLGEAYRQLGQYEAARERFDAVLRIQPDSVKACYGLATVYMALKQADEAQVCLDKFRKLKAADVQADRDRRSQYDDVQEVRAQIAQTYTQMGILYARQRDLNSAEQLWKRAAELDQRHVECRSNLARFYQQTRQPHKALALCCELAALEPGNGAHPYNMGMMHANLRQFDAALQAFEKARELAPEQSASYRLLAQMFLEMGGDIDQARAHAQQAVTLEARAENYFVLGAVKIKQGDSAGATEALRQALRLEPNNPKYQSTFEAFQKRMQQEK